MIPTPEPNLPVWFEAITGVSNWVMAIAALVALIGLFNWRSQVKWERRVDAVSKLVILIYGIQNKIWQIRCDNYSDLFDMLELNPQKFLAIYEKYRGQSSILDHLMIEIRQSAFEAEIFTNAAIKEDIEYFLQKTVVVFNLNVGIFYTLRSWNFANLTEAQMRVFQRSNRIISFQSGEEGDYSEEIDLVTEQSIAKLKKYLK